MYWDVWKDSDGDLHIIPCGGYRIFKRVDNGKIFLFPMDRDEDDAPVAYDITTGVMVVERAMMGQALQFIIPPVEDGPPA